MESFYKLLSADCSQVGFFAWEKILTLDQLIKWEEFSQLVLFNVSGMKNQPATCPLYEDTKFMVFNLYYSQLLVLFGCFLKLLEDSMTSGCWGMVRKGNRNVRLRAPLCLIWCIWKEHNRGIFDQLKLLLKFFYDFFVWNSGGWKLFLFLYP